MDPFVTNWGIGRRGQARALETIERNGKVQTRLIEDLLDSSRIISGQLRIKAMPIDLKHVINLAIDSIGPAANEKSVQIRSQLDYGVGLVSGDSGRLQQVLSNLLTNAVKFSPNGGCIDVHLERTDLDARITVTDNGIGFAADFLPFAFEIFRQADSTSTRSHGGLGLGLTISRKIVEAQWGTLTAENRLTEPGPFLHSDIPLINTQRPDFDHARIGTHRADSWRGNPAKYTRTESSDSR